MTSGAVAAYAHRPINRHRLAALQQHAGQRVLDVGCGNGAYVDALLPERDVIGVDWATLPVWKQHPSRFVVGLADALPFVDASFDTASCFETLEHLPDPARALAELRRVARSNVILTVPNCEVSPGQRSSGLIYHHWIDPTHRNFWSHDEFLALVRENALDVLVAERVNATDLRALITEAYTSKPWTARVLRTALRFLKHRPYEMTTLVVAVPQRSAATQASHDAEPLAVAARPDSRP